MVRFTGLLVLWGAMTHLLPMMVRAQDPVPLAEARVGGIEIGAKGIKATYLTIATGAAPRVLAARPVTLAGKVVNPTLGDTEFRDGKEHFEAVAIEETLEALEAQLKWLRGQGVEDRNIHIAFSSGVPKAANLDELVAGLCKLTDKKKEHFKFLSVVDETELALFGLVERPKLGSTILVDIGAGNIKVGYYEPPGAESLGWASVVRGEGMPGTVVMTRRVQQIVEQKLARDEKTTFPTELAKYCDEIVTRNLAGNVDRRPLLVNSERAYFCGGIVWAMTTIEKPEAIKEKFVRFSVAEVENFHRRLTDNPGSFPPVDLSRVPDELKDAVEKEINRVRGVFTPEQLLSGAEILKGVTGACKLAIPVGKKERELIFPRESQFAWILAYVKLQARN